MEGGPPMVSYSMGSINSLVHKITQLPMQNNPRIEQLLQNLKSLRDDLMDKFAGGRAMGEQVKAWMKQVREMVYNIQDWIDLKQEAGQLSELDIDEFEDQIQKARGRYDRYELLHQVPTSDSELVLDAQPSQVTGCGGLLLEDKTVLVGITGPKTKILNHLQDEQRDLKVVSIHGSGGHGKTPLAKEICGDNFIKARFDCQAFVSVGRTASLRTTLTEILRQVKSEADACQSRILNDIIKELRGFLRDKRYFICIDGIQNADDSEVIIRAFPENNLRSRILATTRMEDIAISLSKRLNDVVYKMEDLNNIDSEELFLRSIYGSEENCPDHFKESLKKIFEFCACGGVPLAIIIAAGLLRRRLGEKEVHLQKQNRSYLSESIQIYSTSQAMRKTLDICYGDLPLPLKSCFLYLSSFSGDYEIKKDHLIRRWAAEGLIPERHGKNFWETGESYFEELISRRLIKPAFDENDDKATGCTIHGVIFDFIESLSAETNFITPGAVLKPRDFPPHRVRRVNLHCIDEDEMEDEFIDLFPDTFCPLDQNSPVPSSSDENSSGGKDTVISSHLSKVRSVAFSGNSRGIDLSVLKHVRVLDLENASGLENKQLDVIRFLSLLRYLALGRTDVADLPEQVMELGHLATLDIRRSKVRSLPTFGNTKLVSLLADSLAIRRGMGGMQELQEVSQILVGSDGSLAHDVAEVVSASRQLRMLGVKFAHIISSTEERDRQGVKQFIEEVVKSDMQCLVLVDYPHCLLDLLIDCWPLQSRHHLQKFELRMSWIIWPQKVPLEMPRLIDLTHLHIAVVEVEAQGVRALGNLRKLVFLKLYSDSSPRFSVSRKDGFECLTVFWYCCQCRGGMGLQFEEGAMPQLRRLQLEFNAQETMTKYGNFDFGIQHLSCLVRVRASMDCKDVSSASELDAAEGRIRDQVSQNSNKPVLELHRRGQGGLVKAATAPAEVSVIAIHSLDEWMNQVDPNRLVLVHFTTTSCPASRIMAPVFADLSRKFPNVIFLKVDVGVHAMGRIAHQFKVGGVPTFLFMKGGDVMGRVVGANKKNLVNKLKKLATS